MTMPSPSDGTPRVEGSAVGDAPFLPPARSATPVAAVALQPAMPAAPSGSDAPVLPGSRPPTPATPAPAPAFDAKAMVASQKHFTPNPAYGAMPAGTDEGRAAARQLRAEANRKRARGRFVRRVVGVVVVAGLAVGGYFAYQAIQADPSPDDGGASPDADSGDTAAGALTPLGEQEQVIDALDDVNSGATPSAGALLDAVDDAREVVGQSQPSVAGESALLVADVLTPVVLDHSDVLDPADGWERFVVRTADLIAVDPGAHAALVEQLTALPQVDVGAASLAAAPVVLPGDIGIAMVRDGDTITRIVAVATDPTIRTVGP